MLEVHMQRLLQSVLTGIKITRPVECSTQRWFLTNVLYEGDGGGSHATTVAAGSHWYQHHKASWVSHTWRVFLASGFIQWIYNCWCLCPMVNYICSGDAGEGKRGILMRLPFKNICSSSLPSISFSLKTKTSKKHSVCVRQSILWTEYIYFLKLRTEMFQKKTP